MGHVRKSDVKTDEIQRKFILNFLKRLVKIVESFLTKLGFPNRARKR
jgi:hypothetical protein